MDPLCTTVSRFDTYCTTFWLYTVKIGTLFSGTVDCRYSIKHFFYTCSLAFGMVVVCRTGIAQTRTFAALSTGNNIEMLDHGENENERHIASGVGPANIVYALLLLFAPTSQSVLHHKALLMNEIRD